MSEIMFIIALIFSSIAGIYDLKTTEVPDEIPVLMIISGITFWYMQAVFFGSIMNLIYSVVFGTVLLGTGFALYKKGQWGGADALLLAAIAYMLPVYASGLFMPKFIINFLIVGAVYTVVYTVVLGFLNPKVIGNFIEYVKKKLIYIGMGLFTAAFIIGLSIIYSSISLIPLGLLIMFLPIFWVYAKTIEKHVFRKKIMTKDLKIGDVTEGMIWRGMTHEDIQKMRKTKQSVIIKEGIRFVPVFALTLVVTYFFGALMYFPL